MAQVAVLAGNLQERRTVRAESSYRYIRMHIPIILELAYRSTGICIIDTSSVLITYIDVWILLFFHRFPWTSYSSKCLLCCQLLGQSCQCLVRIMNRNNMLILYYQEKNCFWRLNRCRCSHVFTNIARVLGQNRITFRLMLLCSDLIIRGVSI